MLDTIGRKKILALDAAPQRSHFSDAGLEIRFCRTAAEASEIAASWKPAALCVDVAGDESVAVDLLRACRAVTALHDLPAVAIVRKDQADWHRLLDAGFVSFIQGSIEAPENRNVIAAISGTPVPPSDRQILTYYDLRMDLDEYKVWRGEHRLDVPTLQFELLKLFMQSPGRIFTKEELIEHVWKDKSIDLHTVNTCCMRLRKTLVSKGGANILQNYRGRGYALELL